MICPRQLKQFEYLLRTGDSRALSLPGGSSLSGIADTRWEDAQEAGVPPGSCRSTDWKSRMGRLREGSQGHGHLKGVFKDENDTIRQRRQSKHVPSSVPPQFYPRPVRSQKPMHISERNATASAQLRFSGTCARRTFAEEAGQTEAGRGGQ